MLVKHLFSSLCKNLGRSSSRKILKMSLEKNDSEDIKEVLDRIDVIKKKLLALTEEVGQVQSALLKVQSKGRGLPMGSINRAFSTSTKTKRKIKQLDDNFFDTNDSPILENKKLKSYSFDMDPNGFVSVYTDGACENNGRVNAKAGYGVWFGENHPLNMSEPVSGRATNNCGEIQACTAAIKAAREANIDKLCINTDSQFVINSMTKWIHGWKKNGWKTADGNPVKNKEDFQLLDSAIGTMNNVKFCFFNAQDYQRKDLLPFGEEFSHKQNYVPGHKGIVGNCAADELARQGAARYNRK